MTGGMGGSGGFVDSTQNASVSDQADIMSPRPEANNGCGELKTSQNGDEEFADCFNINQLSSQQIKFSQTGKYNLQSH